MDVLSIREPGQKVRLQTAVVLNIGSISVVCVSLARYCRASIATA